MTTSSETKHSSQRSGRALAVSDTVFYVCFGVIATTYLLLIILLVLADAAYMFRSGDPVAAGGWWQSVITNPGLQALAEPEKDIIRQALEANHWNRQETAKALQINRTTLFKKMKHYGLYAEAERLGLT